MAIRLDYTLMLAPAVAGGITDAEWEAGARAAAEAYRTVAGWGAAGALGFLHLPGADIGPLREFADGAGQAFSDVVVLGIGGSALGTIALRTALRAPGWNALSDEEREYFPRLHVLDNVDPVTIHATLGRLDLGRTLVLVISKSGGTAETMAQYLILRGRLEEALGERARRHLVFITDPERGALRTIARSEGIVSLDIPPNVGGRYSVLSPVGLLPAALIGIDVGALLEGAGAMAALCTSDDPSRNPALAFAVLEWLADTRHGLHDQVLMPYSDPLREMSDWFVQLWAESLGKMRADGTSVGPTPIAAAGVTDQHSQVQLFMEGTPDKTIAFLAVDERPVDVTIPALHSNVPELAYLGGHTLGELLDAERRATAAALAERGRPSLTIELGQVDAWHVGGLIMLLEIATVHAGALYGIDPLNQPGVELGKRYTYALMGRADAAEARREWDARAQPSRRVVP